MTSKIIFTTRINRKHRKETNGVIFVYPSRERNKKKYIQEANIGYSPQIDETVKKSKEKKKKKKKIKPLDNSRKRSIM